MTFYLTIQTQNSEFICHNSDFFLRNLSLHLTILTFMPGNSVFISGNSNFFSHNYYRNSPNCEIKSSILFFNSMTEISFHTLSLSPSLSINVTRVLEVRAEP